MVLPRGKRSKMKRAQQKYKDQDDEERELRMKALDASGEAKQAAEKARLAAIAEARAQKEAERKAAWEAKQKQLAANQEEKRSRAEKRLQEREELRQLEEEEGLAPDSDDIMNALTALDTLVPVPHPDDIILWAIPVCGPYSAMQHYKFRVKLTPGTQKRGKIAKQSVELFVRQTNSLPREKELMKGVPTEDSILILIGDAKMTISSQAAQQLKADKRQQKNARELLDLDREG